MVFTTMNQRQESAEMLLSSKAAAFSIANLLTDSANKVDRTSRIYWRKEQSKNEGKDLVKLSDRPYKDLIALDSCTSYLSRKHPTQELQTGYSIKKILEKSESPVKRTESELGPLQQFAACCDLVRNMDVLRGELAYKGDPRLVTAPREVQVALQQSELWWKFYACGTEMVITRTGRRMFPTLALSFLGMDPRRYYSVHVDLTPMDGYSYTFANNAWQVSAMASEVSHLPYVQSYRAEDTVHTGLYWMKNGVDFKKIRLTNRRTGSFKEGELHLSPNRKYQPRIHIVEETEEGVKVSCSTYVFPETAFIAVTTYQNEELIQLKIDHNPFAKGFRDKGTRRRFTPYEHRSHSHYSSSDNA